MREIAYKIATLWLVAALAVGPCAAQVVQAAQEQQQSGSQSAPVVVATPTPAPPRPQQTPAQQASHQPSSVLRSSSDLVRIDVEVTDKSGKPIKNLSANQFTVTDEGKPQQITKADVVAVVVFSTLLSVLANFTNDRNLLNKAIAQLTPDNSANLASPLYAAAANGEYDVQEYTGAAYTPDETEFNVFNTDQKLAAVEGLADVLGGIPGRKAMV